MKKPFLLLFLLLILVACSTVMAQLKSIEFSKSFQTFKPPTCGKSGPKMQRVEASAIESIGDNDKFLLVADDKCKYLLIVEAATLETISYIDPGNTVNGNPKWEGLARDDQNYYYAVSSQERKLIRFQIDATDINDAKSFKASPNITTWKLSSTSGSLPATGKIEGLAVKTEFTGNLVSKRTLIVGLREPKNPVRLLEANITNPPANNADLDLCLFFRFAAGKANNGVDFCLSSITYVDEWKGYLILTSSEIGDCLNSQGNKPGLSGFHGNMFWFFPDTVLLSCSGKDIPSNGMNISAIFDTGIKAEGVVVFKTRNNNEQKIKIGIVYDNDSSEGMYQTANLIYTPPPETNPSNKSVDKDRGKKGKSKKP